MMLLKACLLLLVISSMLFAQEADSIRSNPSSQLDFWVGEWKVTWNDKDGNSLEGTNRVAKILDGKVIEENFSAGPFHGKSHSVYDSQNGIWKQTWVDNNGGYMDFTGGMEGEKMILSRETTDKAGSKLIFRMVFYDIKTDSLMWDWEKSEDDGESWTLMWRLHYTRI